MLNSKSFIGYNIQLGVNRFKNDYLLNCLLTLCNSKKISKLQKATIFYKNLNQN
jgi:hypothetical protein